MLSHLSFESPVEIDETTLLFAASATTASPARAKHTRMLRDYGMVDNSENKQQRVHGVHGQEHSVYFTWQHVIRQQKNVVVITLAVQTCGSVMSGLPFVVVGEDLPDLLR